MITPLSTADLLTIRARALRVAISYGGAGEYTEKLASSHASELRYFRRPAVAQCPTCYEAETEHAPGCPETDESGRCGAASLPDGFHPGDTLARAVRRQEQPMRADRDYIVCGDVTFAVAVTL